MLLTNPDLGLFVFIIIGAAAVFCSLMVVHAKNIVHSAVYLAGLMIALAAMYVTLNAEFVASIQVLVYVGAVVTLILFAIMLTRRSEVP